MSVPDGLGTRLIFDIECVALDGVSQFLDPLTPPANYVSDEAIARWEKKAAAERLDKLALDPDLLQVICIGVWREGEGVKVFATDEMSEADLLRLFWSQVMGRELVGFNCLSYDLPALLRRSLYLQVSAPPIRIDKYRHDGVTDLMQVLSYNGLLKYHSLNFYCRRLGIDIPDPMNGAGVGQAFAEGRWDDIRLHCESDIYKTAYLAERLSLFTLAQAVF